MRTDWIDIFVPILMVSVVMALWLVRFWQFFIDDEPEEKGK